MIFSECLVFLFRNARSLHHQQDGGIPPSPLFFLHIASKLGCVCMFFLKHQIIGVSF